MTERRSRRVVQAEETRRLIVDAARRLFAERGYGATGVADIAEAAGVAVPTVYQSVGAKPTLLKLLLDHIDEEADIGGLAGELRASGDPRRVLALQVQMTRQIAERCGDIIAALESAAGVEAEMAATLEAGLARHRAGAAATVGRLGDLGGLRPELDREQATAALATLTMPRIWASLVETFGWSYDDAQTWLEQLLRRQLLTTRRPSR
ncbi:MAG TPA: TetR family transcriptional regulator [Gaiellaceae bacterium]|jgi:AcrR family transcriptional regulator|nr:TetR family transcriptional regulator [Gaiellaceae bacterium]